MREYLSKFDPTGFVRLFAVALACALAIALPPEAMAVRVLALLWLSSLAHP